MTSYIKRTGSEAHTEFLLPYETQKHQSRSEG